MGESVAHAHIEADVNCGSAQSCRCGHSISLHSPISFLKTPGVSVEGPYDLVRCVNERMVVTGFVLSLDRDMRLKMQIEAILFLCILIQSRHQNGEGTE